MQIERPIRAHSGDAILPLTELCVGAKKRHAVSRFPLVAPAAQPDGAMAAKMTIDRRASETSQAHDLASEALFQALRPMEVASAPPDVLS